MHDFPAAHVHFRHCPRCGVLVSGEATPRVFQCPACRFQYYFGSALAAAVFVQREDGRALFIHRARDPGKGRLAPPGGFIDPGEPAEEAARREVREEVGLECTGIRFLCSHPNRYAYEEITYPVLDLFFVARAVDADGARPLDEVHRIEWLDPRQVPPEDLAFPSMSAALRAWQRELPGHDR